MGAGRPLPELEIVEQVLNEKAVAVVVLQVESQNLRGSRSRCPLAVYPLKLCGLADARLPEQHGTSAARNGLEPECRGVQKGAVPALWIGEEPVVVEDQLTISGHPEAGPIEGGVRGAHTPL